jgi:hypothetical protein
MALNRDKGETSGHATNTKGQRKEIQTETSNDDTQSFTTSTDRVLPWQSQRYDTRLTRGKILTYNKVLIEVNPIFYLMFCSHSGEHI